MLFARSSAHKLPSWAPAPGHDIRVIDEQGASGIRVRSARSSATRDDDDRLPLPAGQDRRSPVVRCRRPSLRSQRRRQPFDADGFLVLLDHRKDMIISGGFNVYPSDLNGDLRPPAVATSPSSACPRSLGRDTGRHRRAAHRCHGHGRCIARVDQPEGGQIAAACKGGNCRRPARSDIGKVLKRRLRRCLCRRGCEPAFSLSVAVRGRPG